MLRLIAHRGFAGTHPENTVRAARLAAAEADALEVDARRCGSGEVVAIHDETVDRVTGGTGAVADHTAEELAELSVQGSGAGVPTLEALAAAVPAGVGLVVELKETGLAPDVLGAVACVDDVVVCSFLPETLQECHAVDPDVPLALNVVEATGVEEALDRGWAGLQPSVDACTAEYVERARNAGLTVTPWTVEDQETAALMRAVGVDGIIADRADVVG